MSRGRTGNKIWQLITFSWHTLLWVVNETSDLIGQLDSREPIILLWCTHIINTVDIWNNTKLGRTTRYRERNTNDKENNGGGREEENGASVLCFFWHFLILFVHQSNLSDYSINRKSDACLNGTEFWDTGLLYSFLFVSVIRLRSQHALGIFYSGLWKRLNKIANPNWK